MNAFSHLDHGEVTDVGRKRKNNEDAFAAFPEHGFFCVADGMGGAADGEVASAAAVEGLQKLFADFAPARPLSLRAKLAWAQCAIDDASAWIFRRSCLRGKSGTGTTFAGVAFDPANPFVAVALHAGDSRVYKFGSEKGALALRQLTIDHSVANMVGGDEKRLNPALRNMISKALGLTPSVKCEQTRFDVSTGDFVVICSDGLDKMVSDSTIAAVLSDSTGAADAAKKLVDAALNAGGGDNVTVIVVKVGSMSQAASLDMIRDDMPKVGGLSSSSDTNPSTTATDDRSYCAAQSMEALPTMRSHASGKPISDAADNACAPMRKLFLASAAALIALIFFLLGIFAASPSKSNSSDNADWLNNQTGQIETIAPAIAVAATAAATTMSPLPSALAIVEVQNSSGMSLMYSPTGDEKWETHNQNKSAIELETGEWRFKWQNGDFLPEYENRRISDEKNEPLLAPTVWSPSPELTRLIEFTNAFAVARKEDDAQSWSVVTNQLSIPAPSLNEPSNREVWNAQKKSASDLSGIFFTNLEEERSKTKAEEVKAKTEAEKAKAEAEADAKAEAVKAAAAARVEEAKALFRKAHEAESVTEMYSFGLADAFEVLCENYGYKYDDNGLNSFYRDIWKTHVNAIFDVEIRIAKLPDDAESRKAAIKNEKKGSPLFIVLKDGIDESGSDYDKEIDERIAKVKSSAVKIREINEKLEKITVP